MLLPGTSSAGVADAVIKAELRDYAQRETNINIAAILGQRFLLIKNKLVTYDLFLSLAHSEGINRPRIRKIMYFLWCFRDPRVRRFICERIASSDGHWDINQLVNRANYDFFMQFCAKRTAIKSRSNIENFLFEIGIFDRRNQQIHLELDDGWLSDAGIRLKRDNWVSVRYAEELNSAKSSGILQRTDRHGILGQKSTDFQLSL